MSTAVPVMEERRAELQKRFRFLIRNVRFCTRTGYLKNPQRNELLRHTEHALLAYETIPYRKICRDYVNPVDPRSLLCICDKCRSGEVYPKEERWKAIIARAEVVPDPPIYVNHYTWLNLPPAPRVYWPKTQNSKGGGFQFRWTMPLDKKYAKVLGYEVHYYREIPNKKWIKGPWKMYKITYNRSMQSIKFQHGGFHHFAVRAFDKHGRCGPFSQPISLFLTVFDRPTQ